MLAAEADQRLARRPLTRTWRRLNLIAALVWLAVIPLALYAGWLKSVTFVAAISLYANVASHVAAWRADVPDDESE